jgi:hypothetical protein
VRWRIRPHQQPTGKKNLNYTAGASLPQLTAGIADGRASDQPGDLWRALGYCSKREKEKGGYLAAFTDS